MGPTVSKEHHDNEIRRLVRERAAAEENARRIEHERKLAEEHARHLKEFAEEERRKHEIVLAQIKAQEEAATAERELKNKELLLMEKKIEEEKRLREESLEEARLAKAALDAGRRPVVTPTKDDWEKARMQIRYDPEKLHLAVCGTSGSGKSSLINALRGLNDNDDAAAKVGVTETTTEITIYSDTRPDFSRFVWCDIPGAGTLKVPDWQYFNDQGLFVYDFIILPYDTRLTAVDIGILKNCYRFGIPVFTVRSKADQHTTNMVKYKHNIDEEDDEWAVMVKQTRPQYATATRDNFYKNMDDCAKEEEVTESMAKWLSQLKLYIVSASNLRAVVQGMIGLAVPKKVKNRLMDEEELIKDMLAAAALKRFADKVKEDGGPSIDEAAVSEEEKPVVGAHQGEQNIHKDKENATNVHKDSEPDEIVKDNTETDDHQDNKDNVEDKDGWHYIDADGNKVYHPKD